MNNSKFYIGTISLLLFNVVYFIWQPYIKHILPIFGDYSKISDILTNMLFFVMYFSVLIIIINCCFIQVQINRIQGRKFIVSLFISIAIQIIFDVLKFIFWRFTDTYKVIGFDFLNMVCLITTVFVLLKLGNIAQRKKPILLVLFSGLTLFGFSMYFQIRNIILMKKYMQKYVPDSFFLEKYRNNNIFSSQVITFLFESITSIVFFTIIYHCYGVKGSKIKPDFRVISQFVLRILLIFAAAAFVNVKVLFLPVSFLGGFDNISSDIPVNLIDKNFYSEDSYSVFSRGVSYDENKSVYEAGKIRLIYKGQVYLTTESAYSTIFDGDYEGNKEHITVIQDFTIGDFVFQTYGDIAVMYLDGEKPIAIETREIIKQKKDANLIKICEKLISDGNLSYFEYTAEYLLKYDKDFIEPYIERYADGTFSDEEKKLPSNSEIQTAYIKNIAIKLRQVN